MAPFSTDINLELMREFWYNNGMLRARILC